MVVAFSSHARILGDYLTIHSLPAPFSLSFFFKKKKKKEISLRTLIPLTGQDQSTVAQQAETTVTERSLMSYV